MCSVLVADETPAPLEELEREICELAAQIAAATCRWLLLVAEFDEREGWAVWGIRSCAHWLSWKCSIGLGTARDHMRVARRLRELPLVREAFATGELSYSKVRALTRVATPETEQDLVEIALHATGAQLEKLVRGYRGALSALDAARKAIDQRYLEWYEMDDGSLHLEGRVPAEDGALLLAALGAAEDLGAPDPVSGEECEEEYPPALGLAGRPAVAARRADALVTLARAALAAGLSDGAGGQTSELVVHVDADTLAADEVRDQAKLAGGTGLAPETVRRLGCDTSVVRIVERDGRPLSVGRRTRTISPALRRALRARDDGCRFPGCTHQRFLHAHHIRHWARGGETNLENLVHLCSHHHRLVHEGGYRVERAGRGDVRFRRPDGRPIAPCGPRLRVTGFTLEQRREARMLPIDASTCVPRSAGDSLDYGIAVEGLMAKALAGT